MDTTDHRFRSDRGQKTVVLLRNPPAQQNRSMIRYADAVQERLTASSDWRVLPTALMRSPDHWPARVRTLGDYWDRMVAYPVGASRRRGDIWHICDQGYGHLAAWLPAERTVVTCHDLMLLRPESISGFRGTRQSVIRFRWSVSYLRRVAHVMCDSRATQDDVVRLTGTSRRRTSVVPLGIEDRFKPADPQQRLNVRRGLGYPDDALIVLGVALWVPYKNAPAALETIAALRAGGRDARLLSVGRPLLEEQRALVRDLRLDPWVREHGPVSDEELVAMYNAADVLLFPSFWEGFGWPPLEAMACGTPVVVSTAPALLDAVGDACPAVAASDVRGLADAVVHVTDPGEREAWRDRGLARARRFPWARTLSAVTGVYENVVGEARRRATLSRPALTRTRTSLGAAADSDVWEGWIS